MFRQNNIEGKDLKKLAELKRQNRRRNGLLLMGALQVTSLLLCYYLGRSANQKD